MGNPTVFKVTFIASVMPEYVDYGLSGYVIGSTEFRSLTTLREGLELAFGKDMGSYHYLDAKIVFNAGLELHQAICSADNYSAVIDAIEFELTEPKKTMTDILGA